ncbi:MAG: hypothetical protein QN173_03100 [Armatimonadota bacterium]|nr:hypothetical protein [Armatimonadota bacterium]MDR7401976.1 hypothetical protein [Armatimonadota bacterium]MDR7403938.1 hypothetical protein [Armatimonadota bacterium]MDR7437252.1 hypothetical protein [Armatimonadota bacterium]MDR7471473.1 hypothetical protein [Armatimonadota bacterium]
MSKCHVCGLPDTQTVLVKCQWFGRGTKWLCVECLRSRPLAETAGTSPEGRTNPAGVRQPAPRS